MKTKDQLALNVKNNFPRNIFFRERQTLQLFFQSRFQVLLLKWFSALKLGLYFFQRRKQVRVDARSAFLEFFWKQCVCPKDGRNMLVDYFTGRVSLI